MRVNSGKYKGRLVLPPKGNGIRPTTDKVKEAVFGVLGDEIENAVVVDLFAGSGSLGIEALSRGAKKVYFCDGGSEAIALLKTNTSFLEKDSFEILRGDYADCVNRLVGRGIEADIVLCDPPYGKGIPELALSVIESKGLLKESGIAVVERETFDAPAKKSFAFVASKEYGKTALDFYKNVSKCAVTGTFDPFTIGHKFLVEKALEKFGFCYVVMLNNEEKKARYSVNNRLRMIDLTLKAYKKRVRVDYYDGMTTDYCAENGIKTIIRGVRDEKDRAYEEDMAKYNETHGGVKTEFLEAENTISSTEVKKIFDEGGSVLGMVDDDVVGLLRKR